MALAGWLGQDDLGGHTFVQEDGSELYVPDMPEARSWASRVPDMRTASAPPAQTDTVADFPTAPEAARGPANPEVAAASIDAAVNPPAAPAAQPAAAGSEPPMLPVSAGAQPPPSPYDADAAAYINAPSPGAAPVTQAQLQAKAQQGTAVPTSRTVETSGGYAPDPTAEAMRLHGYQQEAGAETFRAVSADQQAKAEAAYWMNQRIHEENRIGRELAHRQRIEAEVTAKMGAVQQFDDEAQARYSEFGPERFFKRKGTWATIGAAIAQGLGAYAAILGHTENFAGKIIDNAIAQDVEEQRMEYMRDKDTRNNLVADLARATGDLDVATEGAKAVQMRIAQAHGAELAALGKRGDIAVNFQKWNADFSQKIANQIQATADRARGNVVTKDTGKIEYPRAGGGGGAPTYEQQTKRIKNVVERKEAEAKLGDLQGGGSKDTEIAPGVHARDKGEAKDVRTKVADLDASINALKDLHEQTKKNPWAAKIGNKQFPGTPWNVTDTGTTIDAKRGVAAGAVGQAANSGTLNEGEAERYKKNLGTAAGIQGVIDELEIKRRSVISGHSKKPLPAAPKKVE